MEFKNMDFFKTERGLSINEELCFFRKQKNSFVCIVKQNKTEKFEELFFNINITSPKIEELINDEPIFMSFTFKRLDREKMKLTAEMKIFKFLTSESIQNLFYSTPISFKSSDENPYRKDFYDFQSIGIPNENMKKYLLCRYIESKMEAEKFVKTEQIVNWLFKNFDNYQKDLETEAFKNIFEQNNIKEDHFIDLLKLNFDI